MTGPPGTLGRSHRKSVGQGNTGEVPAESGPWDECVPYLVDLHADKRATYTAAAGEYSVFGAACGFGETIICSRREPTTASCRCRADNGNHYSGPGSMSHQWWRTTLSGKAAAYRTAIIISWPDWRNTAPSPRPQNADGGADTRLRPGPAMTDRPAPAWNLFPSREPLYAPISPMPDQQPEPSVAATQMPLARSEVLGSIFETCL